MATLGAGNMSWWGKMLEIYSCLCRYGKPQGHPVGGKAHSAGRGAGASLEEVCGKLVTPLAALRVIEMSLVVATREISMEAYEELATPGLSCWLATCPWWWWKLWCYLVPPPIEE
jgi:hypothetical protein